MPEYFVEPNKTVMAKISDPDEWAKRDPAIHGDMAAIARLRAEQGAEIPKGESWMRVASLRGPILDIAKCLDPDFMRDKKKFYTWLDSEEGKRWCTYDRRRNSQSSRWFRFDGGFVNGTE